MSHICDKIQHKVTGLGNPRKLNAKFLYIASFDVMHFRKVQLWNQDNYVNTLMNDDT